MAITHDHDDRRQFQAGMDLFPAGIEAVHGSDGRRR
jgi:hypothetical protein